MKNIIVVCLLGSIFRLTYGLIFSPWAQAPDQLAWEMLLNEVYFTGALHYDQLIHYPHEGGTILVSIIALIVKMFTSLPALTISAFLLDSFSRFLQLWVVSRLFSKQQFWWFSAWTIFALPSIIPWATVNFGLHALVSCFPFLLLYRISNHSFSKKAFLWDGVFLMASIWFAYSNIVLLPVYIVWLGTQKKLRTAVLFFLSTFLPLLLLHLLLRNTLDAGFELAKFGLSTIRGIELEQFLNLSNLQHIYEVWYTALPGSSLITSLFGIEALTLRKIWSYLLILGLIISAFYLRKNKSDHAKISGLAITFLFILIYSLSPFYSNTAELDSYVAYRHLAYILPIVSLFALNGLNRIKAGVILSSIFLLLGMLSSIQSLQNEHSEKSMTKETGFVLGTKMGHRPDRLKGLIAEYPDQKEELLIGIGWGVTTTLFQNGMINERNIEELQEAFLGFEKHEQTFFNEGIHYAFGTNVSPRLDTSLLTTIEAQLEAR